MRRRGCLPGFSPVVHADPTKQYLEVVEAYGSDSYCSTLTHLGAKVSLPEAGGSVLRRPIEGSKMTDLGGPYPWAGFKDWSAVGRELDEIEGVVSASVVVAPTSTVAVSTLREQFPDHLVDFKTHFLVDLTGDYEASRSSHHRRKARRCRPGLEVRVLKPTAPIEARWVELYALLRSRHQIRGGAAFSDASLVAQLHLPAITHFGATVGDRIVGIVSFIREGPVAAYHLGAYDATGYELEAAYALFPYAFATLADAGVELVNLGGGAGTEVAEEDGLARFKRGWSTHTGVARIGGRVLNREAFTKLGGAATSRFWPPYRARQTP